ncbi:22021_t:CDS:1 [Dentiscutata erythropus]|uniref:22021_t:CDS:1 n=1 Tax=Dentiscutata erythropus TaxID=1348616 RepID=A0A9N9GBN0_9GLOM|nr:22021_t:CDS:1 [Dentiscutata erythropus]
MDQVLAPEYFGIIFRFLSTNKDFHSCLLVNKHWATCAVPILWEAPFKINDRFTPSPKVIQTYLAFIPNEIFLKLGYNERIGLSITRLPLFDYPSFLKELQFDRFLSAAIASNCCKDIIIELFKMLTVKDVRLRRFDIYNYLFIQHSESQNTMASLVLPHFSEYTSMLSRLTNFNFSYQWPMHKAQLFNIIAENCYNIENLKVSICYEDEGIASAALIHSQRHLKKFSLINSNNYASFPVQAFVNQKHALKSVTFEDMHCNNELSETDFFNYAICHLNSSAIDALAQCTKINKLKFKHCERLNTSAFFPLASAFSNLTSLEYSYGTYNICDNATPIKLLSNLIRMSCNTLERIILDWHSHDYLEITQIVEAITYAISLKYLKIPLYTL